MQNFKKIFPVLVGALFILAACQNQPVLSEVQSQNNSNTNQLLLPEGQSQNNSNTDQLEKQAADTERLLKLQSQLNTVVSSKDIKNCDEIKDAVYFKSCNVHILVNQAKDEKNPAACEKATTNEIQQTCLAYYDQAQIPVEPK